MKRIELLAIDCQNDFCDSKGSLFVKGADEDMKRLTTMVKRLKNKISDIHVTLDSHRVVDIAHPIFWQNSKGESPNPFTIISEQDVIDGVWTPRNLAWRQRALDYVHALSVNSRYLLCIWPEHCLIGSWGHSVYPEFSNVLVEWQRDCFGVVDFVTKGSNIFTEHYSFLQADVPQNDDSSTCLNTNIIQILQDSDEILIAGEALSHCVANSVNDLANSFGDDNIKKLVLLEDCCSNVPGFEDMGIKFVRDMVARGMRVCKSTDYLV